MASHVFHDTAGRSWDLTLSIGTVRRLKQTLGVDLLAVLDSDVLARLSVDLELFVNCLFVICQEQARAGGVTDEQFGAALGGDVFDEAAAAFTQALVDFFPQRRREVLAKLAGKVSDLESKAAQLAVTKLDSPVTQAMIEREFSQADRRLDELLNSGSTSGAAPGR
ncbi:MAG: hypothetical protein RIC55_02505 [Pirellulaceae bacterium]